MEDSKALLKDALFRQCEAVYNYMEDNSNEEGVFFGRTTEALKELNFPAGQYSMIFRTLKDLNCVVMIKRGGGHGAVSEWQLIQAPDIEEYYTLKRTAPTHTTRIGAVEDAQREMANRQTKLENDFLEMFKLFREIYEKFIITSNDTDMDNYDDMV